MYVRHVRMYSCMYLYDLIASLAHVSMPIIRQTIPMCWNAIENTISHQKPPYFLYLPLRNASDPRKELQSLPPGKLLEKGVVLRAVTNGLPDLNTHPYVRMGADREWERTHFSPPRADIRSVQKRFSSTRSRLSRKHLKRRCLAYSICA